MIGNSLPLLRFQGGGSPASRLDARLKIGTATVALVAIVIANDSWQFLVLGALVGTFLLGARVPPSAIASSVRPVLVFVVVGGALVAFGTQGSGWSVGFANVSRAGLLLAGRTSVQLILILLTTTSLTYSTSPFSITHALRRMLGFLTLVKVPVEDLAMMLMLAITFVPIMSQEIERNLTARVTRGANPRRLGIWAMLGDMLVPLLESNLTRGDELALALETRLYGYGPRTHRHDNITVGAASIVVFASTLAIAALTLTFA